MTVEMGAIVKVDERGRLVVPSEFRKRMETDYFEIREEIARLVLIPIPNPLKKLVGRVSRAKPMRNLGEVAEEEAERTVREEMGDADT